MAPGKVQQEVQGLLLAWDSCAAAASHVQWQHEWRAGPEKCRKDTATLALALALFSCYSFSLEDAGEEMADTEAGTE
jgi:hypothetical protein